MHDEVPVPIQAFHADEMRQPAPGMRAFEHDAVFHHEGPVHEVREPGGLNAMFAAPIMMAIPTIACANRRAPSS